jgi:hypothetical protein
VNGPEPAGAPAVWDDHEARSRIFAEVTADRDGPTARWLLTFTTDQQPAVRRSVFELLDDLSYPGDDWSVAADAAERALDDPVEPVRRAAAWLLMNAGGHDRTAAALAAAADPVVRVALVEAMTSGALRHRNDPRWSRSVISLRSDHEPPVRLLAAVEALRSAAPADWPELDAAVRADLEASAGKLAAPGSRSTQTAGVRWAGALSGRDREDDCVDWAERLVRSAASTPVRLAGVELAVQAMRTWRAPAVRLAPVLAGLLTEGPSPERSAAARALGDSLTATRLTADPLLAMTDDPEIGDTIATALGSVGDLRVVPQLARLMHSDVRELRLTEALHAVVQAGADAGLLVAAARQILCAHPEDCPRCRTWTYCPVVPARRVLAAFGPAAAGAVPDLVAKVRAVVDRDAAAESPAEVFILGAIGPAAAAAVPVLRRYAERPGRKADSATWALVMITSDRAPADRFFAERPENLGRCRIAPDLLTWLADHGGLTGRQRVQLRHLFDGPGSSQIDTAGLLWRSEGPPVADVLLEQLPHYLHDDFSAPEAVRVLATMGRHARPLLGRLEEIVSARWRRPAYTDDPGIEIRADEVLLAAAAQAVAAIKA